MKIKLYTILLLIFGSVACFAQGPHDAQLYGMTQYGGAGYRGTIFHYTPSTKTYTVDYEFQVKAKGKAPKCEIVSGQNGKYYGTTAEGGAHNAGVIFSWDSVSGEYAETYDFNFSDGTDARGGMVLYKGKLYGMTNAGGSNNMGTIYEWDLNSHAFQKKIDFDSLNGKNPTGSLTLVDSIFYGFTYSGGQNNKGILFTWNPATNQFTKKYDFDSSNGSNPVGKLLPFNGKFYAMTTNGGNFNMGVIYEWNPGPNTVTKKFNFYNLDGTHPMGYLSLYNNKMYGITSGGGLYQPVVPVPAGVIFEFNPVTGVFAWKKDLGFLFTSAYRRNCNSITSLTLRGNVFWGTTTSGLSEGGIFSWNPATNVFADHLYNGFAQCEINRVDNGKMGMGALYLSGDLLLGTNSEAGGLLAGCIYKYSPDSNQIVDAVHMQYSDGAYPKGSLVQVGRKLFGFTFQGGRNHCGNIVEWDLKTKQFTERFTFNPYSTGNLTKGGPVFWNGKLYGINGWGKSFNGGIGNAVNRFGTQVGNKRGGDFFSWDPASNQYTSHGNAGYSLGTLTLFQNKFYTTSATASAILRFDPSNDSIKSVAFLPPNSGTFNNYQDYISTNSITYGNNGKFYGLTPAKLHSGALPFRGTIYEWDTTTTVMTHKIDFVDSTGVYPTGDLLKVDNDFYGLTSGVGMAVNSSLFKYSPGSNTMMKMAENPQRVFGTPIVSKGKIYYASELFGSAVHEYDPVLDTIQVGAQVPVPLFFSGTWNFTNCVVPPTYLKLLEVIPNEDPVLSNVPTTQSVCNQQTGNASFTIFDADNDTIHFTITSSDTSLIHPQNIVVTNVDSVYTMNYLSSGNQTGSDTIRVTGIDGYGGSVQFSMVVNVKALPNLTVTQHSDTLSAQETDAGFQWIDCLTKTIVAGASNPVFIPPTNGIYAAVITKNNCSDTSACLTVTTAGTAEPLAKQVLIVQPNPAQEMVELRFSGIADARIQSVRITNLIGETLLEKTNVQGPIRISSLQSGIYFIRVQSGGRVFAGKLLKK